MAPPAGGDQSQYKKILGNADKSGQKNKKKISILIKDGNNSIR
jgi:hypothetical protein